jgi:hypothetical protein
LNLLQEPQEYFGVMSVLITGAADNLRRQLFEAGQNASPGGKA